MKARRILAAMAVGVLFAETALFGLAEELPAENESEPAAAEEIVTVYPATCTQQGYTLYENIKSGVSRIEDGEPATGHVFGEWQTVPETGEVFRICEVCGEISTESGELPRLEFTGSMEGISKSDRITLGFDYRSDTLNFSCYSFTTWQGHSSLLYDKKNFTIRLFDDAEITQKHKMTFYGWQREHKYILKANYTDPTQARNLVAARVWAEMVDRRENLSERVRDLPTYGAVDGFPVSVWLNGEFLGLYTMNLHKDEDLYGMGGNCREAVVIANAQTGEESLFRSQSDFLDDVSDWEMEYCGTEDDTWARECFNELIDFVMNSDDETFRESLGDYLDVDGAIDYLIAMYALGLTDSYAKDLVFIRYEDTPWIPTVYDMETAFGLTADGKAYIAPEAFVPVRSDDDTWDSGTGSLLWDRLLNVFAPEIGARYRALREDVLVPETLTARIYDFVSVIPENVYRADAALYPNRDLADGDPLEQIGGYINGRIPILDECFKEAD